MSNKWHARWPITISDATEPASTLAAVLCVIRRVFVIVLLPCNIFQGRSVFPWKSRSVRFPWTMGVSSATVGFSDVFGAVGLVSERVVCADAANAVCVRATGTCRVVLIGLPVSRCGAKTIKGQSEQKAEYLIYKQKVGVTLKRGNILPKMEWLANVSYCTQLFHRLCCKTLKHHPGTANASNNYLKCEKKLLHWPPAAADACLGRCDCMRVGERQSVTSTRRFVWISPRVLTGDHTQRCTDTCDGQS